MTLTKPPGYIQLTKASVYADRAARGIDLDKAITRHIEQWRDTVPSGTLVTLDHMLNCGPQCTPGLRHYHYTPGKDMTVQRPHGLPIEIVMDHLFPPDGSPCAIDGVIGRTMHGPLQNPRLVEAYARYIHKL